MCKAGLPRTEAEARATESTRNHRGQILILRVSCLACWACQGTGWNPGNSKEHGTFPGACASACSASTFRVRFANIVLSRVRTLCVRWGSSSQSGGFHEKRS